LSRRDPEQYLGVGHLDADLRRPRQHRLFGLENVRGASTVAVGDVGLRDALVPHPRAVGCPDLVEAQVVVLGSGVQADRHVDQPEGHRSLPDRAHSFNMDP